MKQQDSQAVDLDPAAPATKPTSANRIRANYGDPAANTDFAGSDLETPPSAHAAPPSMPIDAAKLLDFLHACTNSTPRVVYGLGKKIAKDSDQPGKDFKQVDCSGFVRAGIRRSTTPKLAFPDGSVVQHDWVRDQGYPRETIADGMKTDGHIRIAFLSPADSPVHIGHVVVIINAKTIESHGGAGPDSRAWTGAAWQAKARVYRLK